MDSPSRFDAPPSPATQCQRNGRQRQIRRLERRSRLGSTVHQQRQNPGHRHLRQPTVRFCRFRFRWRGRKRIRFGLRQPELGSMESLTMNLFLGAGGGSTWINYAVPVTDHGPDGTPGGGDDTTINYAQDITGSTLTNIHADATEVTNAKWNEVATWGVTTATPTCKTPLPTTTTRGPTSLFGMPCVGATPVPRRKV